MRTPYLTLTACILALLSFGTTATGQSAGQPLTLEDYMQWVGRHHPAAATAGLLAGQAEAAEQSARGGFDPKLYAEYEQKYFDGKEYFGLGEAGISVPTWMGIELKGSYQIANGNYLDPEHILPEQGQASLGVEISLLRGMIIDERRGALRQAQLMAEGNRAQGRALLNHLFREAGEAYWIWTEAYNNLQVLTEALRVAQVRQRGLVSSFRNGDAPAVDTLEAWLQVQTRQLDLEQAEVDYRNAGVELSNFLWLEGQVPLQATDSLRPSRWEDLTGNLSIPDLNLYRAPLDDRHPELLRYQVTQQQLEIDRRLASEQLKPRLDAWYYLLGDGFSFAGSGSGENDFGDYLTGNYKWGLSFEFPLFLRKERGKLALTRIKQAETDLKYREKRQDLDNKIEAYHQSLENLRDQILLTEDMVNNYRRLLEAENRLFQIGESSVFLINSREQKLLEAQLKLSALKGKWERTWLKLDWAAGLLN